MSLLKEVDNDADAELPTTSTSAPKVSFVKKGSFAKRHIRKRGSALAASNDDGSASDKCNSSSEDDTKVYERKRRKKNNPMIQTTNKAGVPGVKRATMNASTSEDSSDSDQGLSSIPGRLDTSYESSKTANRVGTSDMGATATNEVETELDRDAQAVFKRSLEINKELKGKDDDKVYRGMNAYTKFYEVKDKAIGNAASGLARKGPIRAPANLRQTVRWDYQPDICKDYKETGFCGFGDSCKFMHDRSDYKHGWELERDFEQGRFGKDDDVNYEISSDEDDLPFKCFICRSSFKDPVITKCRHYFCERCALDHYRTSQRCYICGAQTNGVFNPAKELMGRLISDQKAKGDDGVREQDSDTD